MRSSLFHDNILLVCLHFIIYQAFNLFFISNLNLCLFHGRSWLYKSITTWYYLVLILTISSSYLHLIPLNPCCAWIVFWSANSQLISTHFSKISNHHLLFPRLTKKNCTICEQATQRTFVMKIVKMVKGKAFFFFLAKKGVEYFSPFVVVNIQFFYYGLVYLVYTSSCPANYVCFL